MPSQTTRSEFADVMKQGRGEAALKGRNSLQCRLGCLEKVTHRTPRLVCQFSHGAGHLARAACGKPHRHHDDTHAPVTNRLTSPPPPPTPHPLPFAPLATAAIKDSSLLHVKPQPGVTGSQVLRAVKQFYRLQGNATRPNETGLLLRDCGEWLLIRGQHALGPSWRTFLLDS